MIGQEDHLTKATRNDESCALIGQNNHLTAATMCHESCALIGQQDHLTAVTQSGTCKAELKQTISARPQLIGSVSLLLAAGWSQIFLYWIRSIKTRDSVLNLKAWMKMKVTQREERKKSFLPIGWSASLRSRVLFLVSWRHSEYDSENMNVWMLQCFSFTPLKTRWAGRGFTNVTGETDFMYEHNAVYVNHYSKLLMWDVKWNCEYDVDILTWRL